MSEITFPYGNITISGSTPTTLHGALFANGTDITADSSVTSSSGTLTATAFVGSGAGLTDIPGGLIVGEIRLFGMSVPAANFLAADGSAVSRTTYADLFAEISTTFGVGDGTTTFNVPNFQDNVAVGSGNTYSLAATGGSATVTLTSAQSGLPAHSHTVSQLNGAYIQDFSGTDLSNIGVGAYDIVATPATDSVSAANASTAHTNLQPYLAVNFGICYKA